MVLSQEGMATAGVLCSAGLFPCTHHVLQATGTCFPSWISALVRTCIQKRSRLPVPWSFTVQGEELLKAISRVWRVHTCPFQMLTLSHTPASPASASHSQALWAAVWESMAGDFLAWPFPAWPPVVSARLCLCQGLDTEGR